MLCLYDRGILRFFFNDTPTTEIYPLSLHDALPIWRTPAAWPPHPRKWSPTSSPRAATSRDRKSTRLNSSHTLISYAVFCLKKKKKTKQTASDSEVHDKHR